MNEPKKINFSERQFLANGKRYFIATSVSIGRAVYMEEAKIELERGMRVGQTTEGLLKIYDLLNKGKFADAAIECYNRINAVKSFLERPMPALRMAACFMNREDEDIKQEMTDELAMSKINDWKAEGLSMDSFFTIALIFISEETADLKNFTNELQKVAEVYRQKVATMQLSTPISESLA
jgi:predicted amino acid-binding ACT domain protein